MWLEILKGRDHVKDLDVKERTILKQTLVKQSGKVGTGLTWLRMETKGMLL